MDWYTSQAIGEEMIIVQGETGRIIPLTWDNNENISSYSLSGLIESIPGPNYNVRQIAGTLVPTGLMDFEWTVAEADSTYDGSYTVQFIATLNNIILKTVPELLRIVRSPEWV